MSNNREIRLKTLEEAKITLSEQFKTLQIRIHEHIHTLAPKEGTYNKFPKDDFDEIMELIKIVKKSLEKVGELEEKTPEKNSLPQRYKYSEERVRYLIEIYEEGLNRDYSQAPGVNFEVWTTPNQSHSEDPEKLVAGIKEMRKEIKESKAILDLFKEEEDELDRNPETEQYKQELDERVRSSELKMARHKIEMYEKGLADSYEQAAILELDINTIEEDEVTCREDAIAKIFKTWGIVERLKKVLQDWKFAEPEIRSSPTMMDACQIAVDYARRVIRFFEIDLAKRQAVVLKTELVVEDLRSERKSASTIPSSSL